MDFPKELESYADRCNPIAASDFEVLLPPRDRFGHKGDYGHILIAGGSFGFGGAPALAALAALRTGSGLVSAAIPASLVCGPIARLAPEAMAHPIEENHGQLSENAFLTWLFARKRFDVIAIGPGLGQSPDTAAIISSLLKMSDQPLLLDADALNLIAVSESGLDSVKDANSSLRVLTPHHVEAARLLGVSVEEVLQDRVKAVLEIAEATGAVTVLKGHGTLIAAPGDSRPAICFEGNPGMATGGSGDVLSGIIASLWGQGLSPYDAACHGVRLHAIAGDIAAAQYGERSMVARDIIAALPQAFARYI